MQIEPLVHAYVTNTESDECDVSGVSELWRDERKGQEEMVESIVGAGIGVCQIVCEIMTSTC